jgi:hypothetical protein
VRETDAKCVTKPRPVVPATGTDETGDPEMSAKTTSRGGRPRKYQGDRPATAAERKAAQRRRQGKPIRGDRKETGAHGRASRNAPVVIKVETGYGEPWLIDESGTGDALDAFGNRIPLRYPWRRSRWVKLDTTPSGYHPEEVRKSFGDWPGRVERRNTLWVGDELTIIPPGKADGEPLDPSPVFVKVRSELERVHTCPDCGWSWWRVVKLSKEERVEVECRRCYPDPVWPVHVYEPWYDFTYRATADWSDPKVYAPLENWTRNGWSGFPVFKSTEHEDYYLAKIRNGLIVVRETWGDQPDEWFERVVLPSYFPVKETQVDMQEFESEFAVTDDAQVRELSVKTGLDGYAAVLAVREDMEDFTALLAS